MKIFSLLIPMLDLKRGMDNTTSENFSEIYRAEDLTGRIEPCLLSKSGQIGLLCGLSGKILIVTILSIMVAEILVFVPSIINFKNAWLYEHLGAAEAASIVYLDDGSSLLSKKGQKKLLKKTHAIAIIVHDDDKRTIITNVDHLPQDISDTIDLTKFNPLDSIIQTFNIMTNGRNRIIRIFGQMTLRNAQIEIIQSGFHLRDSLLDFAFKVFFLSLTGSLISAGLVLLFLYRRLVLPMRHMSQNLLVFSKTPENVSCIIKPSNRRDEIGVVEQNLSKLQSEIQAMLRQKQRLADLGLAVSKINHDMRNILSSAQILSDRLYSFNNPEIQRFAPKLVRIIDRAVSYTRSVLDYGKAMEIPPERRPHHLKKIVADVGDLLGIAYHRTIEWHNQVPEDLEINIDGEQFFRIILNLCKNAFQALEQRKENSNRIRKITVEAQRNPPNITIMVSDTGPGITNAIRSTLFRAFEGSQKKGGAGLGLAIAAEFVRAHGGRIWLDQTVSTGTCFVIEIPDL